MAPQAVDNNHDESWDHAASETPSTSPTMAKVATNKSNASTGATPSSLTENGRSQLCTKRYIFRRVLPFVGLVLVVVGILAVQMRPNPPGLEEALQWETRGKDGLYLTIVNAVEDRWVPYVEEWVQKWDNGEPDGLTLRVSRREPDTGDCQPSRGQMKICSGDYGRTDWRGLNALLMRGGYVVSSVAKLNDHYLDVEGENFRHYTVCHELGHGFGLPHTDDNYWNLDLGDCMDYTGRAQNALEPGTFNFELLAQIYGTAGGSSSRRDQQEDEDEDGAKESSSQGSRRLGKPIDRGEIPDDVASKYSKAVDDASPCGKNLDLTCSTDLGNGYSVRVHRLYIRS